jgi:hypothetical protein
MTDEIDVAAVLADGTPAAATAALAAKAAQFHAVPAAPAGSATAARAQLDALGSNADWRGKFFSGDAAARAEFGRLTELAATADATSEALAGNVPEPPVERIEVLVDGAISTRNRADAVASLRAVGLNDDVIRQAIDGAPVSPAERVMAERVKAMRLGDAAWVDRYMKGGLAERNEMTTISTILSGAAA